MIIPSPKPIILITGANGQLGQEFRWLAAKQEEFDFLFTSTASLDITNEEDIIRVISKWQPQYCINCAAYTAVDKAESESKAAYKINQEAVQLLAKACQKYKVKFLHVSTDYVYDSISNRPIVEEDSCTPRSIYGQSKRAGEESLMASQCEWMIIRVSWLYSSFGNNFVKTMLRLGESRDQLTIVSDQIGAPTYARNLAKAMISIISKNENKVVLWNVIYNYSNIGSTNWADFASEIFRQKKIKCEVIKQTTEAYGAAAPRPLWSVLNTDKIARLLDHEIITWEAALSDCLSALDAVQNNTYVNNI